MKYVDKWVALVLSTCDRNSVEMLLAVCVFRMKSRLFRV